MSAKHTPGPWTYERRDCERYIHTRNGEALQCDARYYPWVSANEADWHLIAAAPELLKALSEMVRWHAKLGEDDHPLPIEKQEPELQEAMRAIAKATGDSL
jgi:hypothetical protein